MTRSLTLTSVVLCALLLLFPLHPVGAATKRKSSSTAKKKSSSTSAKKPPASEEAATEKKPDLDLPLPGEVPATTDATKPERAPSATVEAEQIIEFAAQPPRVQKLLRDAIDLTRQNLTYTFGSAEPEKGGMDCSGTIYYLLRKHEIADVARDSSSQYLWARKRATFFPVVSKSAESVEFEELQPGDLMFWTGTYDTKRDVPISHVMLYLGREKETKKRVMFGASDGRSYDGIQRWGVSVFDFKMPKPDEANPEKAKTDFVGFARIPGLRSAAEPLVEKSAAETETKATSSTKAKSSATPAPKKKTSTRKRK